MTQSTPIAGAGEIRIVPEVRYRDVKAAVAWYRDQLGFEMTFEVPGPGGTPAHVEMRLGNSYVFLSPYSDEGAFADVKQFLNLIVDDPDSHHARAKAAGAKILIAPTDTPFGARFYALRDAEDVVWWISTYRPAKS
jgi:uncharacterized glyoxalase superfamily protein PhnB